MLVTQCLRAFSQLTSVPGLGRINASSAAAATRIIDCGNADAYSRAHVQNAIRLPIDPFLKDQRTGEVIDAELFQQLCSVMGVGQHTHVIAYDGGSIMWASRLWWLFQYYGHERVSILDGGWPEYVRSGGIVAVAATPMPNFITDAPVRPFARKELLASGADVLSLVESNLSASSRPAQILDTRSVAEFTGADLKGNARGGHVPGALNVPHAHMLTAGGTLKEPAELARLFEQAGLDLSKDTVSYCQLGIRGALGVLALRVAGSTAKVANYDGSMKEWLNNPKYPVDR